jgi:hypothetical protein
MSTEYATKLMIDQHLADLRQESEQNRLARLARPRRPRWWERLMLSRTRPGGDQGRPHGNRGQVPRRPAATAVAGTPPAERRPLLSDAPC